MARRAETGSGYSVNSMHSIICIMMFFPASDVRASNLSVLGLLQQYYEKDILCQLENWMIFFIIERDNFSPNIIALNEYKENRRSK